jgi:hypothetical protein
MRLAEARTDLQRRLHAPSGHDEGSNHPAPEVGNNAARAGMAQRRFRA